MRVIYALRHNRAGRGQFWGALLRSAVLALAALALLAIALVGLFVVLPLLLLGSIALYFYLRRQLRHAHGRPRVGVIDAEYTVVDHR